MTYTEYISKYIRDRETGEPIYTNQLASLVAKDYRLSSADASAAVSVAMKRLMDRKAIPELRRFQKGIYYKAKATLFGETGISREHLIADKYLANNNGYETGLSLLHLMGLTTQMPAVRSVATNKASDCSRADDKLGVLVCPPKTRIDEKNKKYLQLLDALELIPKTPVDVPEPLKIVAKYIQRERLGYRELLYYADRHYSKQTVLLLAHVVGEGGIN